MDVKEIEKLLIKFQNNKLSLSQTLTKLKDLPYQNLGFARIDHHRTLRQGFPEVIYCPGKTTFQIFQIIRSLAQKKENVLATRATLEIFKVVKRKFKKAQYNPQAKTIIIKFSPASPKLLASSPTSRSGQRGESPPLQKGILIVTGGTADIPVAEEAVVTAEWMGHKCEKLYDVGVAGIHRLFENRDKLEKAKVIIVIAGMEGALASVVGGLVAKPVIAVPTSIGYGANFGGVAPLLAMLNSCAPNVCVVNIDDGFGAGVVASLINK